MCTYHRARLFVSDPAVRVVVTADFREFVRVFTQRSAFHWKRENASTLWQRSYFEHVLRDKEDTIGVARYILENPVRAGFAESKADLKVRLYVFFGLEP